MVTVPNQRTIVVNKKEGNKQNKYTINTLAAIDEAAFRVQSKGGFKLYMYIARHQDTYTFALSSSDFLAWSGLSITSYRTAFEELVQEKYLIPVNESNTKYKFYDISREEQTDTIEIINDADEVEKMQNLKKQFNF